MAPMGGLQSGYLRFLLLMLAGQTPHFMMDHCESNDKGHKVGSGERDPDSHEPENAGQDYDHGDQKQNLA